MTYFSNFSRSIQLNKIGVLLLCLGLLAGLGLISGLAYGDQSTWSWSRVRSSATDNPTIKTSTQVRNEGTFDPGATNDTIFDISISLYSNPAGDNDPSAESTNPDDTAQRRYEDVIGHFADAVCEQTNGQHHLGRVSIFRGGALKGNADIVWQEDGHIGSSLSGFGIKGRHIYMYDTFGDLEITGDDAARQSLGYLLGHEWGHYVYGVFDEHPAEGATAENTEEYEARESDDVTDLETIMKDAAHPDAVADTDANYNWLNHSTSILDSSDMPTSSALVDTDLDNTVQGRIYRKSGWDVLLQSYADDPKELELEIDYPHRTVYADLTTPTAAQDTPGYDIDLGDTDCPSDTLVIVWHGVPTADANLGDQMGDINGVAFSHDAKQFAAVTEDSKVLHWDLTLDNLAVQELTTAHGDAVNAVAFSPDGTQLATGSDDNMVFLWDLEADLTTTLTSPSLDNSDDVNALAYSPDGNQLAAGSADMMVRLWDLTASDIPGQTTIDLNNTAVVNAVAYSPDGDTLATGGAGNMVRLWDLTLAAADIPGQTVTALDNTAPVTAVAFSPDGTKLAVSAGDIHIWDIATSTLIQTIDHSADVGSLSFSPDGTHIASVSGTDVLLWDVTTGTQIDGMPSTQAVDALASYASGITATAVAFSPDGTKLASGSTVDTATILLTDVTAPSIYLDLRSEGGSLITYPEPILLTMTVAENLPITGAAITATITSPPPQGANAGVETSLMLNDAGNNGDAVAGDGIYSVFWDGYELNGLYDVSVAVADPTSPAPDAAYIMTGLLWAKPQGTPAATTAFSGTIAVSTGLQLSVAGVPDDLAADDAEHHDDPTATMMEAGGMMISSCTAFSANNEEVAGKIDPAGDVDCFSLTGLDNTDYLSATDDLVIRLTDLIAADDYNPTFTVYQSDGMTEIETWAYATNTLQSGGLILTIPVAVLATGTNRADGMIVAVKDVDADAQSPSVVGWSYNISAGTAIASDAQNYRVVPSVSLSLSSESIIEGADPNTITVTATLSEAREMGTENLVVTLDVMEGAGITEGASGDYTLSSDTITIMAGETTGTATLTINDDTSGENDETLEIRITKVDPFVVSNGTLSPVSVTIVDDDSVVLSLSSESIIEGDTANTVTVTATIGRVLTDDLEVTLEVGGDNITEGSTGDYTLSNDTITIATGATTGTAILTIIDDNNGEGDETLTIHITEINPPAISTSISNGTPSSNPVSLMILDDDATTTVSLSVSPETTIREGDTTPMRTITATLASAVNAAVTVNLSATADSTATATDDYILSATSIMIAANATTGTATITIVDDDDEEEDETIELYIASLSSSDPTMTVSSRTPIDQPVTVTIQDNDSLRLTLSAASPTVGEGNAATITITSSIAVPENVEVTLAATANSTATATDDYTLPASSIVLMTGETSMTANISTMNDDIVEAEETIEVYIAMITPTTPSTVVTNGTPMDNPLIVTITDTDEATVTLTVDSGMSSVTVDEEEMASTTITATLSAEVGVDVVVTLAATDMSTATAEDDPATANVDESDYTLPASITIAAGETTGTGDITIADNNAAEEDETIEVYIETITATDVESRLTNDTDGTGMNVVTVTIQDDDAPRVSLTVTGLTTANGVDGVEEGDDEATITITARARTLDNMPVDVPEDVVVMLAVTANSTATADDPDTMEEEESDYTIPTSITIAGDSSSGMVVLEIMDDMIVEGDETIEIYIEELTPTTQGTVIVNDTPMDDPVTVTITDADTATVSLTQSREGVDSGELKIVATLSALVDADVVVELTSEEPITDDDDNTITLPSITIPANMLSAETAALPITQRVGVYIDDDDITSTLQASIPDPDDPNEMTMRITSTTTEQRPLNLNRGGGDSGSIDMYLLGVLGLLLMGMGLERRRVNRQTS